MSAVAEMMNKLETVATDILIHMVKTTDAKANRTEEEETVLCYMNMELINRFPQTIAAADAWFSDPKGSASAALLAAI